MELWRYPSYIQKRSKKGTLIWHSKRDVWSAKEKKLVHKFSTKGIPMCLYLYPRSFSLSSYCVRLYSTTLFHTSIHMVKRNNKEHTASVRKSDVQRESSGCMARREKTLGIWCVCLCSSKGIKNIRKSKMYSSGRLETELPGKKKRTDKASEEMLVVPCALGFGTKRLST
jgi:hypothetical protein